MKGHYKQGIPLKPEVINKSTSLMNEATSKHVHKNTDKYTDKETQTNTAVDLTLTGSHLRGILPGPVNMACRKQYRVRTAQLIKVKKSTLLPQDSWGGHHWDRQLTVAKVTDLIIPERVDL